MEKTIENVRKYRNIQLVTRKRRNYLVSEPNNTTTVYTENLLALEMKKCRYWWVNLSSYLSKGKNKKVFGLMEDELTKNLLN